jgi:ABC-2 type transport system permease protein
MTTITMPGAAPVAVPDGTAARLREGLRDVRTVTLRYVLRARSQSDVIIGSLLMPVIFIVLFGYVFGSAIHVPGGHYRSYLMSGPVRADDDLRLVHRRGGGGHRHERGRH